jgi:predicted SprT family Zn-dependent metalloprotease
MSVKSLNGQIRQQAENSVDWRHNKRAKIAYEIFDALNVHEFDSSLAEPVIGFDDAGRVQSRWGRYTFDGDEVSLYSHFDIPIETAEHVGSLTIAVIHNMYHQHLETQGNSSWYHDKNWRAAMAAIGITCKANGDVESLDTAKINALPYGNNILAWAAGGIDNSTPSLTTSHAAQIAQTAPETGLPTITGTAVVAAPSAPKGKSKMKKWSCSCSPKPVNVRCAVQLNATCNVCGTYFVKQEV